MAHPADKFAEQFMAPVTNEGLVSRRDALLDRRVEANKNKISPKQYMAMGLIVLIGVVGGGKLAKEGLSELVEHSPSPKIELENPIIMTLPNNGTVWTLVEDNIKNHGLTDKVDIQDAVYDTTHAIQNKRIYENGRIPQPGDEVAVEDYDAE